MNKTELIAAVAGKCSISKKDAEAVVLATFESITDALV
ncbi:MAG: HU family DNA-binding protein, partial [Clostridia bacterium]|nr:HU family DNA-binding protein [Clostridia bacterium]